MKNYIKQLRKKVSVVTKSNKENPGKSGHHTMIISLNYKQKKQSNKSRVPLIMTYGNYLPNVASIIHGQSEILKQSTRLQDVFKEPPMAAYRRDANLQDILVHAKHRKMFQSQQLGTHNCGKKCAICNYMMEDSNKLNEAQNMTFLDSINCKTANVVYGINCKRCQKIIYVGETGTTLYERFQNHLSSIRRTKEEPVANHFNLNGHNIKDLQILVIEMIRGKDIHYRKIRESFWIGKLCTLHPAGLNQNKGIGDCDRGVH